MAFGERWPAVFLCDDGSARPRRSVNPGRPAADSLNAGACGLTPVRAARCVGVGMKCVVCAGSVELVPRMRSGFQALPAAAGGR